MTPDDFYKKVKSKYDSLSRKREEEISFPQPINHTNESDQVIIANKILNQNIAEEDFKQLSKATMKKIKWGKYIVRRVFKVKRREK